MAEGRVGDKSSSREGYLLHGKAMAAYAALTAEDAVVYEKVKEAILRRYEISEETYRHAAIQAGSQEAWVRSRTGSMRIVLEITL